MRNAKEYGKVFLVEILNDKISEEKMDYTAQILFVISGTLRIKKEKESILQTGDFVYVGAGEKYTYYLHGEKCLILRISINYAELREMISDRKVDIECNSAEDGGEKYEQIRGIFNRLLAFLQYNDEKKQTMVCGLLYELMYFLISDFSVSKAEKESQEERVFLIIAYLNANYKEEITLQSLSNYLGLTKEYVSKYFVRKLGCSFLQYLDNIRMNHAEREMLSTDKTIMDIALDNGYASAAAFARSVKKKYGLTPQQYRQENSDMHETHRNGEEQILETEEILEQIQTYVNKHSVEEEVSGNVCQKIVEIDSRAGARWIKNWNRVINFDNAEALMLTDIQKLVLKFKDELGIEYVRLSNIWGSDLFLLQEDEDCLMFNFNRLDNIIDFLVRNKLHPFINLDWTLNAVKMINHEKKEVHERFLKEFLNHYYGFYGQREVSQWILSETQPTEATNQRYFECFDTTYNRVKALSETLKIGGGTEGELSKEEFVSYIHEWKDSAHLPDFIVLKGIAFGRERREEFQDKWGISFQNENYIQEKLWAYRQVMDLNGWNQVKIFVTEWDFSDSDNNVLNDNIFKGAWIMRNAINSIGFADIMGYRMGIDKITKEFTSDFLLSGRSGLLNHNGIEKPAFFAMRFLKESKESLLCRDDNGMVTTDDYGHFTILCHNYKHPNYHYFTQKEEALDKEETYRYFSDHGVLHLRYYIYNIRNGKWAIRIHKVDEENGNLWNCWKQLDYKKDLIFHDIEYLRHICRPKLEIKVLEAENQTLILDLWLDPNEFQYIHLFHMRDN